MRRSLDTRLRAVWRSLRIAMLCLLATLPITASAEVLEKSRDLHVRALFLYNFANFVEWPNDAFESTETPLKMCLFGSVPFGSFLDTVNNSRVRDRRLQVLRTTRLDDIRHGCHILFVGADRLDMVTSLLNEINPLFVLSVGSIDGFTDHGGIINILRTSDQQTFDIHLARATDNGLLIDSDLLSLARIINN